MNTEIQEVVTYWEEGGKMRWYQKNVKKRTKLHNQPSKKMNCKLRLLSNTIEEKDCWRRCRSSFHWQRCAGI